MNTSLPTGTVTFLFTDIEGSTKLAQEHAAIWEALRGRHHAILQAAIETHQGHVFKTIGDAFCAAFQTARDGLEAALDAQRKLDIEDWGETPVRVRMGLHTGEAETDGLDYTGYLTLSRVQRLMSAGHGGQVLISQRAQQLVQDKLPEAVTLRDMGEHRLKDLIIPERIYQLCIPNLRTDFPPLKTLNASQHNLPAPMTSFIGRDKEMLEVKHALGEHRLVTLTGAGGTGKTRLSLQVAFELLDQFPDGIWFVELAPLSDPGLIPQTMLAVLGSGERPGKSAIEVLKEALQDKKLLVVLDNCEHLIEASARLVNTLLSSAPRIKILASSREALDITGETIYRIPPLEVPHPQRPASLEQLRQYAAVRLFMDRAALVQPDFEINSANASAVAQICRRLDGIPLAIELAAARIRILSAQQIAERLDDRFRLLTGGSRTALPRQQTLRASMDWSYDLLSAGERTLLERLSVFSGGWTLGAAEQVCRVRGASGILAEDILDLLTHLVDKSLVIVDEQSGQIRYRFLEIVRQYAGGKLQQSGSADDVRHQHASFFAELAEEAEQGLRSPGMSGWIERLGSDHDNFRAALEWSLANEPAETSLQFGRALGIFWSRRGYLSEGREWLERMLQHDGPGTRHLRAKALAPLGWISWAQGDYEKAKAYDEECLALSQQLGDKVSIADASNQLGQLAIFKGDFPQAGEYFSQSIAICDELGYRWARAWPLLFQGQVKLFMLHWDPQAKAMCQESLELFRELGDETRQAHVHIILGEGAHLEGDLEGGRWHLEQAVALSAHSGDKAQLCWSILLLGNRQRYLGELPEALKSAREGLRLAVEMEDKTTQSIGLDLVGAIIETRGKAEQAALLFGAASGLRESIHYQYAPVNIAGFEPHWKSAAASLGAEAYQSSFEEGRAISHEQAVKYALEGIDE